MPAYSTTPRVLCQCGRAPAVAATFGASLFDAIGVAGADTFVSTPLAEMKMARMQEDWRRDDAVAVLGPDRGDIPGLRLPLGRAVEYPSTLSVQCPAQGLTAAGWYRDHPRKMPHMRLGVVGAVFDQNDRVLLTRRARHMRSFPGSWVMPGGGLEPGESFVDAVMREVSEETGIALARETVRPIGMWESVFPTSTAECIAAGTGITAHYLVVFYAARPVEVDPRVVLQQEETDLAVWLTADQLADTMSHPLGGLTGAVPAATAGPGLPATVALDNLAGIYPRPSETDSIGVGVAQGNLFVLAELLKGEGVEHTFELPKL